MKTLAKTLIAAAVLTFGTAAVAAPQQRPAQQAPRPAQEHAAAARACSQINEYQPARFVSAVNDGRGNLVVWVRDTDGDLWMCNADRTGNVYANDIMAGDMLNEEGLDRLLTENVFDDLGAIERQEPKVIAESICRISAPEQPAQVISTAPDGMNDYTVFVRDAGNDVFICNASGDAEIFSFVEIGRPLNRRPTS
jgi:hypothetical protein